jgi:hypothetical protein
MPETAVTCDKVLMVPVRIEPLPIVFCAIQHPICLTSQRHLYRFVEITLCIENRAQKEMNYICQLKKR